MPCTIGFNEQDKILEVVYQGEMAGPELRVSTHDILTALAERKADRVLLDCSEAHFDVPALSVYQLPDVYESRGLSRQARAAVLMPRDGYRKDLFEFYEDVCTNRGYFVKLFTDVPAARAWLKEP
jgi:hypothetical protein